MELHLAPVSLGQDCRIPILRRSVSGEVRSTSVSGNNPGSQAFPGCAITGREQVQHTNALLDHLVGEQLDRVGHLDADGSRRLQIDDELEFAQLDDGQFDWLYALEDLPAVHADL